MITLSVSNQFFPIVVTFVRLSKLPHDESATAIVTRTDWFVAQTSYVNLTKTVALRESATAIVRGTDWFRVGSGANVKRET